MIYKIFVWGVPLVLIAACLVACWYMVLWEPRK